MTSSGPGLASKAPRRSFPLVGGAAGYVLGVELASRSHNKTWLRNDAADARVQGDTVYELLAEVFTQTARHKREAATGPAR